MKSSQNFFQRTYSKKAQIIMYDFIFAFVIFLFVLTAVFTTWYMINNQTIKDAAFAENQDKASYVLRSLLDSPGYPPYWEQNYSTYCINANCSLGLANKPGIITNDKLNAFIGLYNSSGGSARISEIMRVPDKVIIFQLLGIDGKVIKALGYQNSANRSVSVQSPVIINSTTYIWKVIIES